VLFKHNAKDAKGPILQKNQVISSIAISFPADKEMDKQLIIIKKAEVRRIEHDIDKKLYRYAFEFMDIDNSEKKKLVQFIYYLQRQYLQRR
jgi:c-di-GMP-binding flagellar brake protein YcgR